MVYRSEHTHCPSCREPLIDVVSGGLECPKGCGVYLSFPEFLGLMRDAQPQMQVSELLVHNDGTPRRPCPRCRQPMDIAWLDFLQLDQCEQDGVWFDAGELPRALAGDVVPPEIKRIMKAANKLKQKQQP